MKAIVFDLELNQPSQSIIEIGAYLVNLKSLSFLAEFQTLCRLPEGEKLCPHVSKLCHLTEEELNAGVDRVVGIAAFWNFVVESQCGGFLMCWGRDLDIIREQSHALGIVVPSRIHLLNLLEASKVFGIHIGKNARKGLGSAASAVGIPFQGQRHRACPDSRLLGEYLFHILRCLERYVRAEQFVNSFFTDFKRKSKHPGELEGYLPPETLENRAPALIAGAAKPEILTREIPETFVFKGSKYRTLGPARMEDAHGNWTDGYHFGNEEGKVFFRSLHSFYGMLDRVEKPDIVLPEDGAKI